MFIGASLQPSTLVLSVWARLVTNLPYRGSQLTRSLRTLSPMSSLRISCITALVIIALFLGCGGGSSSSDQEVLDDAANDIRVGRDITRCGVLSVDEDRVTEIESMINAASGTSRAAGRVSREIGSVPVSTFVHVLASGESEAEGNVSDSQVQQQMAVLNTAFASTAFRFELAGVSRTIDPAFVDMQIGSQTEAQVKQALRQGDARTLNIYIAAPANGVLGYAYFPWDYRSAPILDGVVVLFETLPGGPLAPYNEGQTLVHEVGHWLGLFHTFQGECGAQGDLIFDTPAEMTPAFGCQVGRDSCASDEGPDPVTNFMDYSDDSCFMEFSPGQIQRMDDMALVFREL